MRSTSAPGEPDRQPPERQRVERRIHRNARAQRGEVVAVDVVERGAVGARDPDHAVEATGATQRRIDAVLVVRGADDEHRGGRVEALDLLEDGVDDLGLVDAVAVAGELLAAADAVDLVDEQDRRRVVARLGEGPAGSPRCAARARRPPPSSPTALRLDELDAAAPWRSPWPAWSCPVPGAPDEERAPIDLRPGQLPGDRRVDVGDQVLGPFARLAEAVEVARGRARCRDRPTASRSLDLRADVGERLAGRRAASGGDARSPCAGGA